MNEELFDTAIMTMGFFPQSYQENGRWVTRSDYQNGWNAALIALFEEYQFIKDWYCGQSAASQAAILDMFRNDSAWAGKTARGECVLVLNMNDVFVSAADYQEVIQEQIPYIVWLWNTYSYTGLVVWVAKVRGLTPRHPATDYHDVYNLI